MIEIIFNGAELVLEKSMTMQEFLSGQGYVQGCFAVTLNRQFIPGSQYHTTMVSNAAVIDIITPMQGG